MKKLFILLVVAVIPFMTVKAQIVGKSSDPSIEFVIKRVTELRNGSYRINLHITNHGKEDINSIKFLTVDNNSSKHSQAYDDEGVSYPSESWFISDGARRWAFKNNGDFVLPSEVPIRVLIDVDDIDEFATKFLRFDLALFHFTNGDNHWIFVQFKDIPLPRNQ